MSNLTNGELLLLANFIYLRLDIFKEKSVEKLVHAILYKGKLTDPMLTQGECGEVVNKDECISVLRQIKNNSKLTKLRIENIESDISGVRTACFIDKHNKNITVVFRGTKTLEEWGDNGEGAYKIDTPDQLEALNYVNNLSYSNITVTGHSKGGNKAKYVALLSDKVSRCISFDGQGFSNEFIDNYSNEIIHNKNKIISISAKYDYVNCLLNSIDEEKIYIDTELQENPLNYHKASIMLDGNGNLRKETKQSFFLNIIYDFLTSLILELPEPHKSFAVNGLIEMIELFLCGKGIEQSILEIVKSTLLLFGYSKHYQIKKEFTLAYHLLQSLSIPFMFWNDFIKIEESHSKEILNDTLLRIKDQQDDIIYKLKTLGSEGEKVALCISNANNDLIYKFKNIMLS